jgi:hypothetical protein
MRNSVAVPLLGGTIATHQPEWVRLFHPVSPSPRHPVLLPRDPVLLLLLTDSLRLLFFLSVGCESYIGEGPLSGMEHHFALRVGSVACARY